jgi:hypothetical protein
MGTYKCYWLLPVTESFLNKALVTLMAKKETKHPETFNHFIWLIFDDKTMSTMSFK